MKLMVSVAVAFIAGAVAQTTEECAAMSKDVCKSDTSDRCEWLNRACHTTEAYCPLKTLKGGCVNNYAKGCSWDNVDGVCSAAPAEFDCHSQDGFRRGCKRADGCSYNSRSMRWHKVCCATADQDEYGNCPVDCPSLSKYQCRRASWEDKCQLVQESRGPTEWSCVSDSEPSSWLAGIELIDNDGNVAFKSGRVEIINDNGKRGVICDDQMYHDSRGARVLCRMLGFPLGGQMNWTAKTNKFVQIAFDDVECDGSEANFTECDFIGATEQNCEHDEAVAVDCYEQSDIDYHNALVVELVGGSDPSEGRIEIVDQNGARFTVCDDGFDDDAAAVFCRDMGFLFGEFTMSFSPGLDSYSVGLSEVDCDGDEETWKDCGYKYDSFGHPSDFSCNHTEDVGVRCSNSPPDDDSSYSSSYSYLYDYTYSGGVAY